MDETPDCERIRPVLAELATGAATGYERDQGLRHMATCPSCRQELAELARAADELLHLMPWHEPPPGFEAAVAQRILGDADARRFDPARPRAAAGVGRIRPAHRRAVRLLAAATAVLLAAGAGAAAELWHTRADRQLAAQYRQALTVANGQYLKAARMLTPTGQVAGDVFLYQGSPSWMIVQLTAAPSPGDYTMWIVTTEGNRYPAGTCTVLDRAVTAGYALPLQVARVAAIELTHAGVVLTAQLT